MRPLIFANNYSNTSHKFTFEEDRLRKSIKGSLESINLAYTTSVFANYDLVHFITTKDIKKISDVKEAGLPVVINAMYCENDKKGALSELKKTKRILKSKAKKCLNLSDVILVPGTASKEFLEQEGVFRKIEIFPIPINFKRFELSNEFEKDLFYRCFRERKNTKYILCIGDYTDKQEIDHLIELAELCNFIKFYFFGSKSSNVLLNKYKKKAPKNVVFSSLVDDDIFRSALTNATAYLVLDVRKVETIAIYEAMAAKTQVFVYGTENKVESYLKDGVNCYVRFGIFDLSNVIYDFINNKCKSTVSDAYKFVKKFDLKNSGKHLETIYKKLLVNI